MTSFSVMIIKHNKIKFCHKFAIKETEHSGTYVIGEYKNDRYSRCDFSPSVVIMQGRLIAVEYTLRIY